MLVVGIILLANYKNHAIITSNEAFEIVLEDLGLSSAEADYPTHLRGNL